LFFPLSKCSMTMYFSGDLKCCKLNKIVSEMCGFNDTATLEAKIISSPNWPQEHNNFDNCEWIITTDANSRIEIVFEQFFLENSYDSLVCCTNLDHKEKY